MVEMVDVRSGDHHLLTSRADAVGRQTVIGPCAVRIPCPRSWLIPERSYCWLCRSTTISIQHTASNVR